MPKFERILCPTDFSDFSEKAYSYGLSLARHYNSELYLLHVVRPVIITYPESIPEAVGEFYGELREQAEQQLREFAKANAAAGVRVEVAVEEGIATESILQFARANSIDMIVMGTHGRRGFQRFALGSVTERVLRKAGCPVMAVRQPAHDFVEPGSKAETVQLRKILMCSDFSQCSENAMEYALSLAAEYRGELTLFHVLENADSRRGLADAEVDAGRRLEASVPDKERGELEIKTVVRAGKPYEEIIKLAAHDQTDLVVVGVRGRNVLDLALFGSTTTRVLQLGPCPVLAIHG